MGSNEVLCKGAMPVTKFVRKMDDELRPEYDFRDLRVVSFGPGRKIPREITVRLERVRSMTDSIGATPLRSLLRMSRLVQMLVKPHILSRQQLGSKNNLPGMLSKVLNGRIDPLQYRDTILLGLDRLHQALGLHRFQHFDRL